MRISVAMACYNGKDYITEQLESIAKQTRKADECVIVDDCSTDGTADVIDDYIQKSGCHNWTLIRNEKNLGYIRAFEVAMGLVNGEIVFLADQDDVWALNKIDAMVKVMCKYPQVLSLCTGFAGIDGEGMPLHIRSPFLTENHGLILLKRMKKNALCQLTFEDVMQRNVAMGCTMAVRKSLIRLYKASAQTNDMPHDWKLNFLAAVQEGLYFWNRELTHYRIHGGNTIGMKVASGQIDRDYRIQEYQRYVSSYHEMENILGDFPVGREQRNRMKKIIRTEKFYSGRIDALEQRNPVKTVLLVIENIPWFGLHAILGVMDILHLPKRAR